MATKKIVLFLSLILFSTGLLAQETHNRFLGNPDAPVTLYEFASLACIHCATFDDTVLPKIKEKYVDTGKAKIIFMDVPFGGDVNLFAHSLLYQTKSDEEFFKLATTFFNNQGQLRSISTLKTYAKLKGLSDADIAKAEDKAFQEKLFQKSKGYLENLGIQGTPTLFIVKSGAPLTSSSIKLVGTPKWNAVEREIERALKR